METTGSRGRMERGRGKKTGSNVDILGRRQRSGAMDSTGIGSKSKT